MHLGPSLRKKKDHHLLPLALHASYEYGKQNGAPNSLGRVGLHLIGKSEEDESRGVTVDYRVSPRVLY